MVFIAFLFLQSEKKYKTKAAQEYRRHLMKIMSEGTLSGLRSPSGDAADPQKEPSWDIAGGLDGLMLSVSNSQLSSLSGSKDNLTTLSVSAPTPVEPFQSVFSAPAEVLPPPAHAPILPSPSIGSLSVSMSVDSNAVESSIAAPAFSKSAFSSSTKKSGSALKKGIVARKLDSSSQDVKMDSFEAVEKMAAKAATQEEANKLTGKLNSNSGGDFSSSGSSRLAAVYQESESIYRAAPAASSSGSIYAGARSSNSTSGVSFKPTVAGSESYQARDRFSSAKSISSDQFFGRDEEDSAAVRARLQKYSGATAISSDMLSSDVSPEENYGGNRAGRSLSASSDDGLGKLKESVRDFFDNLQSKF